MKQGFSIGFELGSNASHILVPVAGAAFAGYAGYEIADYLMETNMASAPENIKTIAEYGSALAGSFVGGGIGYLSKYTYVPQFGLGAACGLVGASLELALYIVLAPIFGVEEGIKFLKGRNAKKKQSLEEKL